MKRKTDCRQLASDYCFGFTLVEILVGIAITGLLSAVGYVNYRDFSRRQSLSSATRAIISDLRLAQSMAETGQYPPGGECSATGFVFDGYRVTVNVAARTYSINGVCHSLTTTRQPLIETVPIGGGDISTVATTRPSVLFRVLSQGTDIPATTTMTITITQTVSPLRQQFIDINSAGTITQR
jgi:prepilin-type N-terminal cleavage/methylation domain-containing protein